MKINVGIDPDTHNIGLAIRGYKRGAAETWSLDTIKIPRRKTEDVFDRIDFGIDVVVQRIKGLNRRPQSVVIEFPEVQGTGSKVNALIPLAALSFGLRQVILDRRLAEEVTLLHPKDWKHPIPKDVWARRLAKHHPQVAAAARSQGADDHALDAAGLILYRTTGRKL